MCSVEARIRELAFCVDSDPVWVQKPLASSAFTFCMGERESANTIVLQPDHSPMQTDQAHFTYTSIWRPGRELLRPPSPVLVYTAPPAVVPGYPISESTKPKGPLNSFIIFYNEMRESLTTEETSQTDLAKMIAARWRTLDLTTKEQYKSKAAEMKRQFELENPNWREEKKKKAAVPKKRKNTNSSETKRNTRVKVKETEDQGVMCFAPEVVVSSPNPGACDEPCSADYSDSMDLSSSDLSGSLDFYSGIFVSLTEANLSS